MMMSWILLPSPIPPEFLAGDFFWPRSSSSVVCGARRTNASIPKLEPFSRSRIDRWIQEPPLLQKTKDDLTDYCSALEGDESYSCWRAYFELRDLENELPKEEVEKLVRQAGGKKILIDCLHGLTALQKKKGKDLQEPTLVNAKEEMHKPFPVPDGLPKTQEELEEEENARMPESPFTRLLRSMGRLPACIAPTKVVRIEVLVPPEVVARVEALVPLRLRCGLRLLMLRLLWWLFIFMAAKNNLLHRIYIAQDCF